MKWFQRILISINLYHHVYFIQTILFIAFTTADYLLCPIRNVIGQYGTNVIKYYP